MKMRRLLLLAGLTLLLTSCGKAAATPPSSQSLQLESLVVKRMDPLHQTTKAFDKTVKNKEIVRGVYDKLLDLPPFPGGPINCPADNGVQYELAFRHGGESLASAAVNATGCQNVTFNNKGYQGNELIALLENVLGLTDSEFRVGFASH